MLVELPNGTTADITLSESFWSGLNGTLADLLTILSYLLVLGAEQPGRQDEDPVLATVQMIDECGAYGTYLPS